ncbi:dienelactone hydrolase family protein [Alcanivorax marinus]|uniref:Dienelactone hydrolase family protein n=1 Tax=Alloalcanivorax marinus TaxID=1177169 RepID=A0A9Q3UP92_9GAMM|nr:alpha/beta family hydrolase [Alloalcanivorax marinus]MCC4308593.1 dienelactone hydrolase family protein [Alloalcanivorax marinus]
MTDALNLLWDRPAGPARATLLLAHGAGAPMDSPFMARMAALLAARGVTVARFEFAYMARRREEGVKAPPDRAPKLLDRFRAARAAVAEQAAGPLWVGGKSMGGRMATLLLAAPDPAVAGAVVFGYPFHPPGKPERTRLDHFPDLTGPLLICQGERDPFGRREEVEGYRLSDPVTLHWAFDGDHDLKPRQRSGSDHEANLTAAADRAAAFMDGSVFP